MFSRRRIIAVAISVLATIALGVSMYLTWTIWQSSAVAGCTGEALLDCDYSQMRTLLEGEKPPVVSIARKRALSLVGEAILLDKKLKAGTNKRLTKQALAFKQLNSSLPILLFPNGALRGVSGDIGYENFS